MLSKSKKPRSRPAAGRFPRSINLYKFIRLILGNAITDSWIAQKWGFDPKNYHDFKTGRYPVPRLVKLEKLATILDINRHLVFQVATGTPARKVFNLLKKDDLSGQIRLLSKQLDEAHRALAKSEKRYRELFSNANDAIFIADTKTERLLDCNKQAEQLLGRSRTEIIGMNRLHLHPSEKRKYYKEHFKRHVRLGKINEAKRSEIVKTDGTIVPVRISSSVIEIDGKKVIQGIFRDISQVKQSKR